jgi:hypothetical protein
MGRSEMMATALSVAETDSLAVNWVALTAERHNSAAGIAAHRLESTFAVPLNRLLVIVQTQ